MYIFLVKLQLQQQGMWEWGLVVPRVIHIGGWGGHGGGVLCSAAAAGVHLSSFCCWFSILFVLFFVSAGFRFDGT